MERALLCALLLFLLGGTAGETWGGTCPLGPYGAPLPHHPLQCPGRLDGSGESSLHGAPDSPGKARGADPPAEESSRTWALISGVSAEEVTRSPIAPRDAGIFLMEAEQCQKWVHGQAIPTETFQCPTQDDHPEHLFCCGTCTASYCCSSLKDRLEQASCPKIMEETEDKAAGESTGPSVEMLGTLSIIEFVLIAVGLVCICIGISYILRRVQVWITIHNEQRAGHGQPNVVREFPARPAVGHPAQLHPPSLVAEESPRGPQLPSAVASPPDGSGSPMVEMTRSPAFLPEGNLELPAGEKDTAV